MNIRSPIFILLFVCAFILAAGCTHPEAPAPVPVTPAPTTPSEDEVLPPESCSLTPGPTQVVPDYESVSITVDRNTISEDPTITTRFDGGKGLGMVQTMTVTVIRSDCVKEQQTRRNPGIGTSITQMGTTKSDRVIVMLVMTSGDEFTVIDQLYPFAPKI